MGLMSTFLNSIRGVDPSDWMDELDIPEATANRLYLKNLAKDTVLNFVARTMSTAEIKLNNSDWEYLLNVKPNLDMSASDFWQVFFYRLLDENEVLVIITNDNQFLIADDFSRKEHAVFEDIFEQVTVKGYTFQKSFPMSKVIYMTYNNENLKKFTNGLFDDYAELFGRILEIAMRNNQIRATVSIDQTGTFNDSKDGKGKKKSERLQKFINKIYASFSTNSVAIVPKLNGFEYEEYTNKSASSNQSLEELTKLVNTLIDDVANSVGVPTSLIYGEKSELDQNLKAYWKLCIYPLVEKLRRELSAKLVTKQAYKTGDRVTIRNVLPRDPLEYAVQADKLVSGGDFFADEVREMFNYDPLPDGQGQVLRVTKNYEETKGGENENDETEEETDATED